MKPRELCIASGALACLALLATLSVTSAQASTPPPPPEPPQPPISQPVELPAWEGPGEPLSLGALRTPPDQVVVGLPPTLGGIRAQALAASVDLSGGMPPVGDQLSQGSCVAWATGYYYKTYQEGVQHGWSGAQLASTANQRSPAYLYNQRLVPTFSGPIYKCQHDLGWYIGDALDMLSKQGADSLSSFNYDEYDACDQPSAAQRAAARPYRAASYGAFFYNTGTAGTFNNNITPLKQHLSISDTLVINIPVYSNFATLSSPDCDYTAADTATASYVGGHALAVVGYDDNRTQCGSQGGFKIRNSWGSSWCYSGDGWLCYDYIQQYAYEAWWMTDIPWDTAPYTVSLPLALRNYQSGVTPPGIYGQITQNGTPVPGAQVRLDRYNGFNWWPYQMTTTDSSGNYRFTGAASLGGQWIQYQTSFINHSRTAGRAWQWMGTPFSPYTAGTNRAGGDFEVSDVTLVAPNGAVSLPYVFMWNRRAYTSDSYELNIWSSSASPWWGTVPALGYTNSYTMTSAQRTTAGLSTGTPYYWDLVIYATDGAGWSYDTHEARFNN